MEISKIELEIENIKSKRDSLKEIVNKLNSSSLSDSTSTVSSLRVKLVKSLSNLNNIIKELEYLLSILNENN